MVNKINELKEKKNKLIKMLQEASILYNELMDDFDLNADLTDFDQIAEDIEIDFNRMIQLMEE